MAVSHISVYAKGKKVKVSQIVKFAIIENRE